ncbi:synaptic vesicle glycoprotein 2C-like [Aethina tumida]|uniref:synaptic vesicle glycoprotein 2C-like n=1 Tax=Aethina tumida TaxID=116153 RepID=UPI002148154D|nr:synaptic vesicle glycoprotein 2C-like [Aethina tumida]XP_019876767.2 synaptic vesicle glycoprotein 2C-like [Aethina tumida]
MNSKNQETNQVFENVTFDEAVKRTGYGKFHAEVITVCAISILTVGFQNGLSSYVFPAAECELQLTSYHVGILNVTFLVGGILSSFLWGFKADLSGRKQVIMAAHLLNFLITVFCAVNPLYISLFLCRFCNGFLISAPGSIIFSYLAEFQPPKYRGAIVCYCGLFFTLAWLVLPVTAYFVLPIDIHFRLGSAFILSPWRFFLIVLVVPELIVGLWFLRLPESPKFHMTKGNKKLALNILKTMYARNTGKPEDKFPVKNLVEDAAKGEEMVSDPSTSNSGMLEQFLDGMKSLFRAPLLPATLLTCFIMFSNMFGVFGLGLWLPELFIRFQKFQEMYPNASVTVKELSALSQQKSAPSSSSCSPSFDNAVIVNTIAVACTSLVYNAVAGWLTSRVHIKTVPLVSMLLGGVSCLSIYWLTSSTQNLIVSCIFQATMITANMTIGSVGVELFPTSVGAIAISLIMFSGRVGAMCSNIVFGLLMDKHCEIPIFVVAVVVLLGTLLCFLIPEKEGQGHKENDYKGGETIEISVISKDIN